MKKILSLIFVLFVSLSAASLAWADANIEPKNPLEKERGAGNMDVPTETLKKAPTATPMPTPKPKVPEKKS